MPTPTYTPLANVTLASSAVSVTFSSISQGYKDLILVITGKSASTTADIYLRFNGDTSSYYAWAAISGNGSSGSSIYSASTSNGMRTSFNSYMTTTDFTQSITHIIDYSATNKHKATLTRSDRAAIGTDLFTGIYENTAAITSVMVRAVTDASGFAAGSTFALYGIAA